MDFDGADNEKFIDKILDSMLQLTFKKLLLVEFWYSIKGEYSQWSQNTIKILLPFTTMYLC